MRVKIWPGLIAVPSLLVFSFSAAAAETSQFLTNASLMPELVRKALIVEVAGADETNKATAKQLKDAGTNMVPSGELKKAQPMTQPSANKMVSKPAKLVREEPEPIPAKIIEPEVKPMAKEAPEEEQKPQEPTKEPMQEMAHLAGPYLRIDGGYSINSNPDGRQNAGVLSSVSTDKGSVLGIGLGYRFNENIRADVTASYRPDVGVTSTTAAGNTASTEVSSATLMLNAYWDLITYEGFTPYVGAGIGLAHLDTSDQTTTGGIATEVGQTSENFAWALSVGSAYKFTDNTSLDVNYRYINLGDFEQDTNTTYDSLSSHEIRGGLRVGF